MLKYLVTAKIPGSTRAEEESREFSDHGKALACAEDWAKSGRKDVTLWENKGSPITRIICDWVQTAEEGSQDG